VAETAAIIQSQLLTDVVLGLCHFDHFGNDTSRTPKNFECRDVNRARKVGLQLIIGVLDNKITEESDILDLFQAEISRFERHPDAQTRVLVAAALKSLASFCDTLLDYCVCALNK